MHLFSLFFLFFWVANNNKNKFFVVAHGETFRGDKSSYNAVSICKPSGRQGGEYEEQISLCVSCGS